MAEASITPETANLVSYQFFYTVPYLCSTISPKTGSLPPTSLCNISTDRQQMVICSHLLFSPPLARSHIHSHSYTHVHTHSHSHTHPYTLAHKHTHHTHAPTLTQMLKTQLFPDSQNCKFSLFFQQSTSPRSH